MSSRRFLTDVGFIPCLCAMWCTTLRRYTPSATAPTGTRPARWRAALGVGVQRRVEQVGANVRVHFQLVGVRVPSVTHPARRPRGPLAQVALKVHHAVFAPALFGPVGEARAAHVADLRFNVVGQVSAPALALLLWRAPRFNAELRKLASDERKVRTAARVRASSPGSRRTPVRARCSRGSRPRSSSSRAWSRRSAPPPRLPGCAPQ